MKDIGSIFPLYDLEFLCSKFSKRSINDQGKSYFSLCRQALFSIASNLKNCNKKVLIPAYSCSTVVRPFKESGWECFFYPVSKELRIDIEFVKDAFINNSISLFLVHPFFGMDLNSEEIALLKWLHKYGCKLIVDQTQCLFSEQELDFVDYYVGSYRKWFPIPDGAFLKSKDLLLCTDSLTENNRFVSLQASAMYLRGLYFESSDEEIKGISRRLDQMAVELAENQMNPQRMSDLSIRIMNEEDTYKNKIQRIKNYQILFEGLNNQLKVASVCRDLNNVSSAPLYFPVYVHDRENLQKSLAKEHIYAPVLWPVVFDEMIINDAIREIYDTLLALPIDQRYDQSDMNKILRVVNDYYNA